jgi:hypothetical protein
MTFKKRKADRRKLDAPIFSGAAEVCETRALLSADGLCLPAVDADAVVIEDIEATDSEEVVDFEATLEAPEDGEFLPELAICTMLPMIEGEVFEDLGDGDENEVVDPSLMFYSFMPFDGGGDVDQQLIACEDYPVYKGDGAESEFGEVDITNEVVDPSLMLYSFVSSEGGDPEVAVCDGLLIDEVAVDSEEPVEVTFEDFDPSWVIRSFGAPSGEVVDDLAFTCGVAKDEVVLNDVVEEVVVDEEFVNVTTPEDYDPSWAYRSFVTGVPEDGTEVTEDVVDGEEKPEVVEEEHFDITTMEDYDPSWAYRGIVGDGEVVVEEGERIEEDPVVFLDHFIVVDGVEIPWRDYYGMNFRDYAGGDQPVKVFSVTSGAPSTDSTPSVMGPVTISTPVATPAVNVPVVVNQPTSLPVVVTPTLAIPVNGSGFTPLFVEEEELLVTTLAPAVSDIEPLVSEVVATASSGLDFEFGDLIDSSSDSPDATVGELTPIFEDEQAEEPSLEAPATEDAPVETEESVGSVEAPQQPVMVASRATYGRSIDEFMSEFAMSGFAG